MTNSDLLPKTDKNEELETENKKLKAEIQKLRQIKQELDNYIEQATGIKNFSQNILKRKAILQGFFARKKAKYIKEELKKEAPECFKKFAEEKKYDKIKELAESLEKEQYHKARQIMQERAELEFICQGQKIKY